VVNGVHKIKYHYHASYVHSEINLYYRGQLLGVLIWRLKLS